jgi:PIN domain nuclease of toxin-antitoxin system
MSSLTQILRQLRDNQKTFNTRLARVESLGKDVNQSLLSDLIQDARELHESSVILSYVLSNEYTEKSEQVQLREKKTLSDEVKSLTTNSCDIDENSIKKETLQKSVDLSSKHLNPIDNEILTQEEIVDKLEDEISSFISDSYSSPVYLNQEEEDNSLAAKLARKKIENLINGIGINEKFLFTNELFDGNTGHFLKTIDELNNCVSFTEANQKLLDIAQKRSWILEDEPYLKLKSLLSRKY